MVDAIDLELPLVPGFLCAANALVGTCGDRYAMGRYCAVHSWNLVVGSAVCACLHPVSGVGGFCHAAEPVDSCIELKE